MIAIMKGSKKTALATDFVQFISQPEPQAAFARALLYAPASAKAYPLMTPEEKATLPSGHMGAASLQSGKLYLDFWLNNGDSMLQRFITFAAQ